MEWQEALEGLGELGPEARAAIPDLIQLLKHREFNQPGEMQATLTRIGPACVPELVAILADPQDNEELRNAHEAAIAILGARGNPPPPASHHCWPARSGS